MKKSLLFLSFVFLILSICTTTSAKGPGGGGGGGTGGGGTGGGGKDEATAPDYGDLVVILRDADGVPILVNGCIQPLNSDGNRITLDAECEIVAETECLTEGGCLPVEVDFGRLNIARSPDTVINNRFDEVINYIKASKKLSIDPANRLMLLMDAVTLVDNVPVTTEYWKTIDAPLECLALYVQIMKYGHLQTTPNVISSDRGDETTYRPVLDPAVDYAKFPPELEFLLPDIDGSTVAEPLTNEDMLYSSFFLAAAGDKSGKITVDLVQYMNAILGVPNTNNALPGNAGFVNFRAYAYERGQHFNKTVAVILPTTPPIFDVNGKSIRMWKETTVSLPIWLNHINEGQLSETNIADFVASANDSLQVIVLLHNYEIPVDLWSELAE